MIWLGDGSGGAAKNNSAVGRLQERKVCCVSSKRGYKMPQRKFTASRWKPVHVSDGVADGVLQHSLSENQVQSFSGTQRTDSQPDRQRRLREHRPKHSGPLHRWNTQETKQVKGTSNWSQYDTFTLFQCKLWEDTATLAVHSESPTVSIVFLFFRLLFDSGSLRADKRNDKVSAHKHNMLVNLSTKLKNLKVFI